MSREQNVATQERLGELINLVERWRSTDELGIMQQIDAAPQAA